MAKREAWRLAKQHALNLVVVNLSFVVGPVLPRAAPTSTALPMGELAKYPNTSIRFLHVDDVVLDQVLAMEDGRASGRLICSGDVAHWSEVLRERYPQYPIPTE